MELRTYWKILRRRWLIILIPAAIVAVAGLITYQQPAPAYNAGVRFIVGQQPAPAARTADQERYYNWLASEYIVNGLTDWVRGNRFAAAVSAELAAQGSDISPYEIGIAPDNARSMLTISITHSDPKRLEAIMAATIKVLTEQNAAALPQLGGETAVLTQLDNPVVNQVPTGLRTQLDLPLRLALALFAGLGLALAADYLDPTVRDRDDLETLTIPLLGEIPKK